MTKVAILGSENSHAWHFAAALSDKDGSRLYQDIELIGVYGDISREDGRKGNEEIAKVSSCPHFAGHYDDFLSEADAVMVTARHGDNHLKYAYKYIEKGIPVWIDKPITANEADAAAPCCPGKKTPRTHLRRFLFGAHRRNQTAQCICKRKPGRRFGRPRHRTGKFRKRLRRVLVLFPASSANDYGGVRH